MAWSLVRINIGRQCQSLLKDTSCLSLGGRLGLPNVATNQVAFISSKKVREEMGIKRPPPFPYDRKRYNFLRSLFDSTVSRFDENTKVIVVDGNIAAGKTSFAKKLAEELDMYYVHEPTLDSRYINDYGFDLRNLDHKLPEAAKSFDLNKYYKDPHHLNVAAFQLDIFVLRYEFYIDSLCHVLNTGQGIVMDRSVYSDIVFLETMVRFGYVSRNARKVYYKLREGVLLELLRPHLVVYLDVPAKTCFERIKRRALPYETETKVLTLEYLESLEDVYKNKYLREMSEHSEILVFDWSEYGDVEVVVEDIERIDFENYEKRDPKSKDWRFHDTWQWNDLRTKYTSEKGRLMWLLNTVDLTAPELILSADNHKAYEDVMAEAPGGEYYPGYNVNMEDKWLLFKNKQKPRENAL